LIVVGNTIPLTSAAPALQELEGLFGGLKSWQLEIFHVIHEAHDVIEFFREQHYEFDERSRMVTQEVQGYRFGSELVNYTIAVKDVIVQFLSLDRIEAETHWQVILTTFCKNIGQLLPVERKELDFKLKMIENVQLNIQEIRTYFSLRSSSGISIPFILQLMEQGVYQSQLQLHPNGQGMKNQPSLFPSFPPSHFNIQNLLFFPKNFGFRIVLEQGAHKGYLLRFWSR
jgi:hypothetical protein